MPVATPEPDLQPVRVPLPAEDAPTVLVPQSREAPRAAALALRRDHAGALAVIATAVLYLPGHGRPRPAGRNQGRGSRSHARAFA
jgi:hypothetical protein